MTTTVPDVVPQYLPTIGANDFEWIYYGNTFYHSLSSISYSHLPSLHKCQVHNKVGLLLSTNGDLHLFLDEKYATKLATRLPVHKSLFGAVDVNSRCTKIKSEILTCELDDVCLYSTYIEWPCGWT